VLNAKETELEKYRNLELVCQKAEVENVALTTERDYLLEINQTLIAKDVQHNAHYAALHTQLQKSSENILLTNQSVKVTHGQLEGLANSLQENFIATIKSIEDLKEKIKRADHADTA
jgi:NADH/NAD ratio-sensing transcriptional regulator Rex